MIWAVASAVAGGLLLATAFPPLCFDMAAWVALVPLFWAVNREQVTFRAFLCGASFGCAFFLADVNWVYHTLTIYGHFASLTAALVVAAMVVTLSSIPGLFALGLAHVGNRGLSPAVIAPFLWTGLEYVRAVLFTGFPWDLAGYSQMGRACVVQIADIAGVYGVSFLVVLVNAAGWEILKAVRSNGPFPVRLTLTAVAVLCAALVYGEVRLAHFSPHQGSRTDFSIGILQGNIPQDVKWEQAYRERTFSVYADLGSKAVKDGARLLVWPETSVPVLFGSKDSDWLVPGKISEMLGVPMLVGTPSSKEQDGKVFYYNSAILLEGSRPKMIYDKMHLVPFGEYMPLTWLLPLGPGLAAREEDYSAGEFMTVMVAPGCPAFSVLICYEAIFPELARLAIHNGARMLVNITNDGWFGHTAAPYQHLAMAGMRSIENRVWMIRAANTGISCAFDPAGRMVGSIPLEQEGFLMVNVPPVTDAGTLYTRFGDLFAWGCIATSLLMLCLGLTASKPRGAG